MSISSIIGDYTLSIGAILVVGFVLWKFVIQPKMNEGKEIEPEEEDIKTFEEKMQDNLNTSVDF